MGPLVERRSSASSLVESKKAYADLVSRFNSRLYNVIPWQLDLCLQPSVFVFFVRSFSQSLFSSSFWFCLLISRFFQLYELNHVVNLVVIWTKRSVNRDKCSHGAGALLSLRSFVFSFLGESSFIAILLCRSFHFSSFLFSYSIWSGYSIILTASSSNV